MEQYIDDTYTILDGTLLICSNANRELVIPSEVCGHKIERIGSGCSVGGATETVILSEGIREVGMEAFCDAEKLRSIELPYSLEKYEAVSMVRRAVKEELRITLHRRIAVTDWEILLQDSILLQDGRRLLTSKCMDTRYFCDVFKGFEPCGIPGMLKQDMGRVFLLEQDLCEVLPFAGSGEQIGDGKKLSRRDMAAMMVPVLIKERAREFWDNASELASDKYIQTGKTPDALPALLCFFRPEETAQEGSKVHVTFQIRFARVFLPNVVTVELGGIRQYIYRELFLTGREQQPFLRVDYDNSVFDAQGNVQENRDVYARYKLLAMLS